MVFVKVKTIILNYYKDQNELRNKLMLKGRTAENKEMRVRRARKQGNLGK